MVEDLKQYLAEHRCKGFRAAPHYFANGDFLTYFMCEDRCFAERVDELLTVYIAFDTKEVVGCKIKGVSQVLKTAGNFGVALGDGEVRLGFLFFAGAATAKDDIQLQRYEQVGKIASNIKLDRKELQLN